MAKFKLTDMHALILSAAIARADESLLPPPEGLGELSDTIRAAFEELIQHSFATEVETAESDRIWRQDGTKSFGLVLTDKGRAAAGEMATDSALPKPTKKIDTVIGLLRRPHGATLPELVEATGWLPHTTRAALTGLRKKGHTIDKATRDGVTCYIIAEAL